MRAATDSLCNWCGNPGSISCGCGSRSCDEMLCDTCAAEAGPARRYVDGKERPVIVVPGETFGGYTAGLTAEQRQHTLSGTAYIVKRSPRGCGWKVAVKKPYKAYWYEPSAELLRRLQKF